VVAQIVMSHSHTGNRSTRDGTEVLYRSPKSLNWRSLVYEYHNKGCPTRGSFTAGLRC
jgi:hypothetical protein